MAKKLSKFDQGFYCGILNAVVIIYRAHGEETLAMDIIKTVDAKELRAVAEAEGDDDIVSLCQDAVSD